MLPEEDERRLRTSKAKTEHNSLRDHLLHADFEIATTHGHCGPFPMLGATNLLSCIPAISSCSHSRILSAIIQRDMLNDAKLGLRHFVFSTAKLRGFFAHGFWSREVVRSARTYSKIPGTCGAGRVHFGTAVIGQGNYLIITAYIKHPSYRSNRNYSTASFGRSFSSTD